MGLLAAAPSFLVALAQTACAIWHDFPNLTRGPCWMSQFTFAEAEQAGKKRDTRRAARPGGAMKWWYGRKYPGTCRQLPVG